MTGRPIYELPITERLEGIAHDHLSLVQELRSLCDDIREAHPLEYAMLIGVWQQIAISQNEEALTLVSQSLRSKETGYAG